MKYKIGGIFKVPPILLWYYFDRALVHAWHATHAAMLMAGFLLF